MVIGTYFGDQGSSSYYLAIVVFTILTVAYTLKGGLRSSLLTDLIQMILFGVLLFIILGMILPEKNGDIASFIQSGSWTMAGGLNLLFVALIQVFSYPFHDPVLTDRAFIAPPKTTLYSFIVATMIGGVCIILFSFVGIYAQMEGLEGQAPVAVSKLLGVGMQLMMNFIMITSAASTLDSTFNSFSKLVVVDLSKTKEGTISLGRWVIVGIALIGTIPIFLGAEILAATTISGTMVIGLTPIFIFWKKKVPLLSYYLSVGIGIVFGIWLAIGAWPESWVFFEGKYGDLLSINGIALIASLLGYWIPALLGSKIHSTSA
jgi:Na+/proline symporter